MSRLIELKCKCCGNKFLCRLAQFNFHGTQFCSRKCSGLARRQFKTIGEKKEEKRRYDAEYRAKNRERLLAEKKAYYQANRDRALDLFRKRRESGVQQRYMKKYLKTYWTPEKKAEKKDYDRKFRAKKFGPYAEAHYLTILLNEEIKARLSNYEIRLKNGTLNKTLQRSRNGQVKRSYS